MEVARAATEVVAMVVVREDKVGEARVVAPPAGVVDMETAVEVAGVANKLTSVTTTDSLTLVVPPVAREVIRAPGPDLTAVSILTIAVSIICFYFSKLFLFLL